MATTKSKKAIIDYLWEWAENSGEWAKKLTKITVEKETELSEQELNDIYALFFKEITTEDRDTLPKIPRPIIDLTPRDTTIQSLSGIKGVNKLAENQTLLFSENMTVIYGENASGKSGYSRILRSLGFSYDKESKVLCNVYCEGDDCQIAKITYSKNGDVDDFDWDGSSKCTDLQGISVFTNNCVKISLDTRRELLVTPIGFHLFKVVSDELDNLTALHKAKIESLKKEIDWLSELNEGTKVYNFLKTLSSESSEDELKKLAEFNKTDDTSLKDLQEKERNLNKNLIQSQITTFQNQLRELRTVKTNIETAKTNFTANDWKNIGDLFQKIETLRQQEQKGLKEIAEERGIEFYESSEFSAFLRAADNYIKKLGKDNYPQNENEICIYCRQRLKDTNAIELLTSYRFLLNDPTQGQIMQHQQALRSRQSKLATIPSEITLHYASFGEDEEKKPLQPEFIKTFCRKVTEIKALNESKVISDIKARKFDIDYNGVISVLDSKIKLIDASLDSKEKSLLTIKEKEEEYSGDINELLDRKKLAEKLSDAEDILNRLKFAEILESFTRVFNTDPLSRTTTQARKDLIAKNFNETFEEELKGLRRSDIKVNLNFRTDKAKSFILQDIGQNYNLTDVLSEGEQKAIALAEFLTELQLDQGKSPIVFDDPVTSLDHKIIDEVARRLVKMSKKRQVIIFTHSILLFNSIKQKSELPRFKDLGFRYYETSADKEYAGFLHESPTLKEDTFKNYQKKINKILNLPKEERDRRETELATEGYNKLRPAIEVFVEKEIFNETVKRYRKNVALTRLETVKGALIDQHKEKINDIFERCCEYIDAHSSPDGLPQVPSVSELEFDFKEICEIRKDFVL